MHMFFTSLLAILLFVSSPTMLAGDHALSGTVRDRNTGEPVLAANIKVFGTARGTVCNNDGQYLLYLPSGSHTITVSSIGYRPDTLSLFIAGDEVRDFSLLPSDIELAEILVTGEDPAYAIIRRAIENKKRWRERLRSYEMDAFTRQVLRRDTAVASITESHTQGFWLRGDTLREVVKQKRQTENVKAEFNFASVGRLLNFYDDDIRFLGYTFVGPVADNAFDHYDYRLKRHLRSDNSDIHEIELIPRSATVPCFSGTINITNGTFALAGVDVEPNHAFLVPFVREKKIRYRQQFSLYEGTYWLPADIRIDAEVVIGVIGISLPRIGFAQTSVILDYRINVPIADSVVLRPRLTQDSLAQTYDSTFWASPSVLPLTAVEQRAYETLDSTQSLDVQFRPGGIGIMLGGGESGDGVSLLRFVDMSFNRVEGFRLGLDVDQVSLAPWMEARGRFSYGFSDRSSKHGIGVTFHLADHKMLDVGFDYRMDVVPFADQGYFGSLFNSLTSLLDKNDYRDYHLAKGWSASVSSMPVPFLHASVSFVNEEHRALQQNTDYSLLRRSRRYRLNPPADDGRLRSIKMDFRIGRESAALDFVTRSSLLFSTEYSSPDVARSDFSFRRYEALLTLSFPTFSRRFLFPPGFRIRIAAGTSGGDLPLQRMFTVDAASSGAAPFGTMKAAGVREFVGTQYTSLAIEHNFRSLPFLALGIPFLYENNVEFVVHGGLANTGDHAVDSWYSETGFGISRIFELLRADFTWRLSQGRGFRFTISAANLF